MRRGYYLTITIFFFPQILALQFDKKSSKGPKVGGNDATASLAICAQLQYRIIFNLGIILCNMIFDIRHGTVGDFDFASVENFVEYVMVWEGVIN